MAHTIATKYNPASGKITAKHWRTRKTIDSYYTLHSSGEAAAHRAAAEILLSKINKGDDCGAWQIIAGAEGIKANEYTFIIEYVVTPAATTEYRVTWTIDTLADSYENAARWVQSTYFAQGSRMHFEVKKYGDRHTEVVDFFQE